MSGGIIQTITEDRNGTLWLGTYGGLTKFENGVLQITRPPKVWPITMFVQSTKTKILRFGLEHYGGGLNRLKDGKKRISLCKMDFDDVVSRIIARWKDNLWMLGNPEFCCISQRIKWGVADGTRKPIAVHLAQVMAWNCWREQAEVLRVGARDGSFGFRWSMAIFILRHRHRLIIHRQHISKKFYWKEFGWFE